MKIMFFLITLELLLYSCTTKNEQSLLKHQYQKRLHFLSIADSMGYKDKAAMLLNVIIFTQSDSLIPNKYGKIEKSILPQWEEERDSAYISVYNELANINKSHTAFTAGNITLIDTSNKHVLAYTCTKNNETFLVVLNMDEDNYALQKEMDYPNMETLFCNYDIHIPGPVTSSLALRPYEARILQIKE